MWHVTRRRIAHSKGRLVLTLIAVAIGVTFLTGSLVLTDSTEAALNASYAQVYAGADVIVRGPEPIGESPFANGAAPLPEALLRRIHKVPGVADAEGRVTSVAQLLKPGSKSRGEQALATGVPMNAAASLIQVRSGRLPRQPDEVAIDATAAERLAVRAGERIDVMLPDHVVNATVVGTVGFGRLDGLAGGARVLFAAETASRLFGSSGYADVVVVADEGVAAGQLRDNVAAALGSDAQVVTAEQAAAADAAAAVRQTALLGYIVMAVAAVALLVGGFLIANTFRMLIGQRARELALLRAVGASSRQVAASVAMEAGVVGAMGSLLGILLGVAAGAVLVTTSKGLVPGLPPMSPAVTPLPLIAGFAAGIIVAVVAARGAVRRALRVSPVAAMRAAAMPDRNASRTRLALGVLLAVAGVAAVAAGAQSATRPVLLGGAIVAIVATGLLFPFVTAPVVSLMSRPIARAGVAGSLARQQTLSAPRRTGATAATLTIALGLVTLLLVFNASVRAATPNVIARRQHAEFTVRSTARQGLHDALFDVVKRLEAVPSVATARVVTYADARVARDASDDSRPRRASMFIVDPAAVAELFEVHDVAARTAAVGDGEIAVRQAVATASGWRLGHQLEVQFGDGATSNLRIAALFEGGVGTDWIVAPATAEGHQPTPYREAFVRLDDGASVQQARPAIENVVDAAPSLTLLSRDQQVAETADANASSFGILTAMFSLSVVIGIIGVVNTLSLSVVERVRELGLLRAVGASRGQVRSMIRWEAMLTSTLGAVVGAGLGLALAWVATKSLPGESLVFTVPALNLALSVVATAVVGVAAAIVPAVRASRIDVLRSLEAQ